MTAISKNVYIGKLNDIVKKYKYRYNRSIKMKPTDITSSTYINFVVQNNGQDLRFKASGHVRISKSKKHFLWTVISQIGHKKFVLLKRLHCSKNVSNRRNDRPWAQIVETIYERLLQKTNQTELEPRN